MTTSKLKYSPVLPYAFTEHGALMAANVLNSEQANSMSVYIVGAFVQLRETILGNSKLALKLMEVEKRLDRHDENINALVNAIECLLDEPEKEEAENGLYRRRRLKRFYSSFSRLRSLALATQSWSL